MRKEIGQEALLFLQLDISRKCMFIGNKTTYIWCVRNEKTSQYNGARRPDLARQKQLSSLNSPKHKRQPATPYSIEFVIAYLWIDWRKRIHKIHSAAIAGKLYLSGQCIVHINSVQHSSKQHRLRFLSSLGWRHFPRIARWCWSIR